LDRVEGKFEGVMAQLMSLVDPGADVSMNEEQYHPVVEHHFVGTTAKTPIEEGGVVNEVLGCI
jgi:hypothetical protein